MGRAVVQKNIYSLTSVHSPWLIFLARLVPQTIVGSTDQCNLTAAQFPHCQNKITLWGVSPHQRWVCGWGNQVKKWLLYRLPYSEYLEIVLQFLLNNTFYKKTAAISCLRYPFIRFIFLFLPRVDCILLHVEWYNNRGWVFLIASYILLFTVM